MRTGTRQALVRHYRAHEDEEAGLNAVCLLRRINLTELVAELRVIFSESTRMNGAGNGKLAAPLTSVLPSKTIVAVAVAERSLRFEPGPLTVVVIGPVPVQRASTETVCNPPRLSRTLANVPLTLTVLRSWSNCVGAAVRSPS